MRYVLFFIIGLSVFSCKQRSDESQLQGISDIGTLKTFSAYNRDVLFFLFKQQGVKEVGNVLRFLPASQGAAAESILARLAVQSNQIETINTSINGIKFLVLSRIAEAVFSEVVEPCVVQRKTDNICLRLESHWLTWSSTDTSNMPNALSGLWDGALGFSSSLAKEKEEWMQEVQQSDNVLKMATISLLLHPRFLLVN